MDVQRVILQGDLSRQLPKQRSKVVRIFTSSTFTGIVYKPYFTLKHYELRSLTLENNV